MKKSRQTYLESAYLQPKCYPWTLDLFHDRLAIVNALRRSLHLFEGVVLDVGCGESPYRDLLLSAPSRATKYVGLDIGQRMFGGKPDVQWNGKQIPLADCSVQSAVATEVLEHCPAPDQVLSEIHRVVAGGGFVFATVPFIWPIHFPPYDEYRYTPFSLRRYFVGAGFEQVDIQALGGWDAALATMLGLWVCRRNMSRLRRRLLQRLITPIYKQLLRIDIIPVDFNKPCMITALAVRAFKPANKSTKNP
jgi:SAM-dependent methyltransferase